MNAISRRLRSLEERGGFIETEESRREREQAEAFLQRVAERRAQEGRPEPDPAEQEDLSGLCLAEILMRGRERPRQGSHAAAKCASKLT